jgi:hypothetical protein
MKTWGLCTLIACLQAMSPLVRADEAQQLADLVAAQSPAIVMVRVVLKTQMNMGGNSQSTESRANLEGVVVSPDGLVMISDSSYNFDRLKDVLGGSGMGKLDIKTTPTDFKIGIIQDEKEYSGFLAASDKVLGLAFIKISDLGDKKLTAVDFSNAVDPTPGQRLYAISRLSKGFDNAVYYHSATLCGEISLPRKAYLLDGNISSLGLPVYTAQGQPVGVLTFLTPTVKEESGGEMDFSAVMRMFGGGGMGSAFQTFVVPGSAVYATINQAKQRAVQVAAERAKLQAAKPAAPPKKAATGKKP